MQFPIYKAQIDPSFASDLEVSCIGLVDRPAIERNFQAFNDRQSKFTINEEKQIISGPAMIADMPIYRRDDQLGEYYVVFDKASIQTIVEKFSAKGYLKNFNLFHDAQQAVSDVTIFNSFVSNKDLGVNALAGFEDINDGSWFISAKVNNPEVWAKVKSGEIKGFSIEGLFNYIPMKAAKMASMDLNQDDIYFLEAMICNCTDAVKMASVKGIDDKSKLLDYASKIIKTNTAAIQEMKQWLEDNVPGISMGMKKMSAEAAKKRIEAILSETDFQQ